MQLKKKLALLTVLAISTPLALFGKNNYETVFADKIKNEKELNLIHHVQQSIDLAYEHKSKVSQRILTIEGMSSPKNRHLLNNICSLPNASYLEIGVWQGSTWIAALYQNHNLRQAIAIDNWSDFGGPAQAFKANCDLFLKDCKYQFYSANCFNLNIESIFKEKVNIYFYDGGHTALDHELALTYYDRILEDLFILIIDDWNHEPAKIGTKIAFQKLNYDILYQAELPTRHGNDPEQWWNGLLIAIIRKN